MKINQEKNKKKLKNSCNFKILWYINTYIKDSCSSQTDN